MSNQAVFLGGGFLHQATVTLTDAQIKALPTTPVAIVAAQGSGLVIVPQSVTLVTTIATGGEYTNVSTPSHVGIGYTGGAIDDLVFQTDVDQNAFVAEGVNINFPSLKKGTFDVANFQTTGANIGIEVGSDNSGNYTGGNAANTLKVSVSYLILNVLTGEFV